MERCLERGRCFIFWGFVVAFCLLPFCWAVLGRLYYCITVLLLLLPFCCCRADCFGKTGSGLCSGRVGLCGGPHPALGVRSLWQIFGLLFVCLDICSISSWWNSLFFLLYFSNMVNWICPKLLTVFVATWLLDIFFVFFSALDFWNFCWVSGTFGIFFKTFLDVRIFLDFLNFLYFVVIESESLRLD